MCTLLFNRSALCAMAGVLLAAFVVSSDDAQAGVRPAPPLSCSKTASTVTAEALGQQVTYVIACTFTPPAPGAAQITETLPLGYDVQFAFCEAGDGPFPANVNDTIALAWCTFSRGDLNSGGNTEFMMTVVGHYPSSTIGVRTNKATIAYDLDSDFEPTAETIFLQRFATVFLPGPQLRLFEQIVPVLPPQPDPPPFRGLSRDP
jgi:hypothetical protein